MHGTNSDPGETLAAANRLVEEARKLVAAQEQVVRRMNAGGLNSARAQELLEAYRASLRLAVEEQAKGEEDLVEREGGRIAS